VYREHRGVSSENAENADRADYRFEIGFISIAAENIDVELPELAQTSALGILAAVHIGYGEPTEGEIQLALLSRDHTRDRGCHLGTDRETSMSFILKIIGLLARELLAALGDIEVKGFEHRSAVLLKAGKRQGIAYLTEEPVTQSHIARIKIARTLIGLG